MLRPHELDTRDPEGEGTPLHGVVVDLATVSGSVAELCERFHRHGGVTSPILLVGRAEGEFATTHDALLVGADGFYGFPCDATCLVAKLCMYIGLPMPHVEVDLWLHDVETDQEADPPLSAGVGHAPAPVWDVVCEPGADLADSPSDTDLDKTGRVSAGEMAELLAELRALEEPPLHVAEKSLGAGDVWRSPQPLTDPPHIFRAWMEARAALGELAPTADVDPALVKKWFPDPIADDPATPTLRFLAQAEQMREAERAALSEAKERARLEAEETSQWEREAAHQRVERVARAASWAAERQQALEREARQAVEGRVRDAEVRAAEAEARAATEARERARIAEEARARTAAEEVLRQQLQQLSAEHSRLQGEWSRLAGRPEPAPLASPEPVRTREDRALAAGGAPGEPGSHSDDGRPNDDEEPVYRLGAAAAYRFAARLQPSAPPSGEPLRGATSPAPTVDEESLAALLRGLDSRLAALETPERPLSPGSPLGGPPRDGHAAAGAPLDQVVGRLGVFAEPDTNPHEPGRAAFEFRDGKSFATSAPSFPLDDEGDTWRQPGVLRAGEVVGLLFRAARHGFTGGLHITAADGHVRTLLYDEGVPVGFESDDPAVRPETLLWRAGFLTSAQRRVALRTPVQSARKTVQSLVFRGFLKAAELIDATLGVFVAQCFSVVGIRAGTYSFSEAELAPGARARMPHGPEAWILEALRQKWDEDSLLTVLGGFSTVLTPARALDSYPPFSPEELAAVRYLDGTVSLGDIVLEHGVSAHAMLVAAWGLVSVGALAPPEHIQADEPSAEIDVDAVHIDTARIEDRLALARGRDLFAFLGLGVDATSAEVRGAVARIRTRFDPRHFHDAAYDGVQAALQEILATADEAEQTLNDPDGRAAHRHALQCAEAHLDASEEADDVAHGERVNVG